MFDIVLIRHGVTEWNQKGLYQGHSDIPLLSEAQNELKAYKIPPTWLQHTIYASPLRRTQETAHILFGRVDFTDPRIIEINMGLWEGQEIARLKESEDYSPPSYGWKGWESGPDKGETYSQVRTRFLNWLKSLDSSSVAITHKGVLLVALALAHNWDMASKRPFKLPADTAFIFIWDGQELRFKELHSLK